MRKIILLILSGLAGFAAKAQILQPDPDTTARHFIIVASIGNLQEVSTGQLAVQKAKNQDVRSFGQMMVRDHMEAEKQLMRLIKQKRYNIPPEATGRIQPDLNLEKAKENFDSIYIHAMLAGHGNAVQTFETYAITGKDADIKAFAQRTLPILKAHLEAIKALDKKYQDPRDK